MIGKTNSSQGVSSIPSEYVNIRMMTNQASHGDLVGAKFVLSYEKFSQEYVWGGSEMTLQVPAYVVCTIEWGDVEGYKKPEAVTFTTVEDNARTVEVEYQCELLTVNVTADEGMPTGFEVTVSKAETIGGIKGYTRLEYIESNGTQWIDTGFKPKYNSRVVMDVEGVGTKTQWLFGTRDQNSTTAKNQFSLYRESGTQLRSDYFGSTKTVSVSDISKRSIVERNGNVVNAFGLTIANTAVATGECPYPLYLFTLNMVGVVNTNRAEMKLYSCQIYDSGVLVRGYIPVKDSNGVAGLYDKVNNVFYPSNSDSNFIAGKEITYKKIEYIENNGNAWINTGFIANGGMKAAIGITPYDVSKQYLFYGSHNPMSNSSDSTWQRNNIAIDNNSQWEVGQSTNIFAFAVSTEANSKYDVEFSTIVNAAPYAVINGQKYTGTYKAGLNIAPTTPVYIMKDVYYENQFLKGKIHYAKIWDNALNLVRDFIPVLRSDGVAGLYDLVNDSFYASSGSDAFMAGKEVTYQKIEYVEANKSQYLNIDYIPTINTSIVSELEIPSGASNTNLICAYTNFCLNSLSDNSLEYRIGSMGWTHVNTPSPVSSKFKVELNSTGLKFNDSTISTHSVSSLSNTYPFWLFSRDGGSSSYYGIAKLYSLKIYEDGVLVRSYTPSLRSDGKVGLYEEIMGKFYTSDSSSDLIGGDVLNNDLIAVQTSATGSYKIPFDVSYRIQSNEIEGFETPEPIYRVASEKAYVATMEYKAVGVKDLSLMDVYGNKIQRSTANCYVVREAGQYKFPLVFGNAIKNGKVNKAAFTNNGGANSHNFVYGTPYTSYESDVITQPYINPYFALSSSDVQIETSDVDGVITDLGLEDGNECKFVTFKVANVPTTGGNVIITLNTAYGDYWSWHIWLWPHDLSPVEITNATGVKYKIMPVNLASKYDSDGVHIKNWFYQWGRPNPLLCPNAWNSTTDHSPGSITKSSKADSLKIGIMNPSKFYYNSSSPFNWFGTKSYYNLWDAACTGTGNSDNDTVKTVYDPCPVGWKVPNGNTFTGLHILSNANGIVKMARYSGDTVGVGFPMSGRRSYTNGLIWNIGEWGYVWHSSSVSQEGANITIFNSSFVSFGSSDEAKRAYGASIRPVQDDNIQLDVIMISFKIDGTTYQAESGMTWFEWVNSSYNTGGFYLFYDAKMKNKVAKTDLSFVSKTYSGTNVYSDEGIIGGSKYYIVGI